MDQQSVNTGHIHQVQTHQQAPQQQMQPTNGQQFVNSIKPDLRYVPTQSYLAQTVKDPLTEGLKILDKENVISNAERSELDNLPIFRRQKSSKSNIYKVNVINNWAFSFKVPLTLHIVFRAGSLVTNLLLSRLILKRQFSKAKYISVATITLGIIICTLVTTPKKQSADDDSNASNSNIIQGLIVMTIGLILSSTQGILQERTSIDYGKHPLESLFLHHFLALPTFWALKESIYSSIETYSNTELVHDQIPVAWLYLAGNLLTQYICIRSVFVLTTECPSLTVTLVVTLRKFFSLLVSVIYFKTYWGPFHWLGTFLVFGGTLLYAENIMSKVTSYFELNNNEKKLK